MNKKYLAALAIPASAFLLTMNPNIVHGAKTDMCDISNHNGDMTYTNFHDMMLYYGVKAITCKISEGTYYQDPTASVDIANAQKAGLYINGYYFCRYTNVQSAINEATFACRTAKADGLPVTAVLCADIESSQQRNLSISENNQCINAMKKVVQSFGYRFDVYAPASFGDVHVPWSQIHWIADYVRNLNQNLFNHGNAWQFRSDQHFYGSYGNFDVSQLYNNYYTGGQNKNAVISENKTANVKVNTGKQNDQMNNNHNEPNNSNLTEDYAQHGIFTCGYNLNVRTYPSTIAPIVATYQPGDQIIYNHVYINNGLVWCRYIGASGYYRYVCMGVLGGQSYGRRTTMIANTYTVKPGDTLYKIASRYGVSTNYIARRNGLNNINLIYAGQTLMI